jgi:hypothetical protein
VIAGFAACMFQLARFSSGPTFISQGRPLRKIWKFPPRLAPKD